MKYFPLTVEKSSRRTGQRQVKSKHLSYPEGLSSLFADCLSIKIQQQELSPFGQKESYFTKEAEKNSSSIPSFTKNDFYISIIALHTETFREHDREGVRPRKRKARSRLEN